MEKNYQKLYKMFQIKGGKKVEKFSSPNIKRVLRFQKWYVSKYHEGLLLEILDQKLIYDWKNKKMDISFE